MSYFKKLLLIPFLAVFVCVGCSSTGPDNGEMTVENYMPLAVGNSWTYRHISVDTIYGGGVDTSYRTEVIDESFQWNGHTVFKKHNVGSLSIFYWLYENGESHTYYYEEPSDTGYYVVFLSEPLTTDNEWNTSNDPGNSYTASIEDVGISISLPAGIFNNCIKVKWPGNNVYYIYAPGIGEIKRYHDEIYGNHTYELTSYTINN